MDYEQEALNLIAQPENIAAALEIASLVEQLKPRFQEKFWIAVSARVESFLKASELNASWRLAPPRPPYKDKYLKVSVIPVETAPGQRFLSAGLEQGQPREEYPLYYGLHWSSAFAEWQHVPEVEKLHVSLKSQGFGEINEWWPGYRYLNITIWSHPFLLRMGTDREAFVKELATNLIDLLRNNIEQINTVNMLLKGAQV